LIDDESEVIRYVCRVRLDGLDHVFLWESGGAKPDRVVLDDNNRIWTFASEQAARDTTTSRTVSSDDAADYDADAVDSWCRSNADMVACRPLLALWNLFTDLPNRADLFVALDKRANGIYDKLFAGCNLPAITAPGDHYVPTWNATELQLLKRLLLLGIAEFRSRLSTTTH
jgi:hypothetical protein